MIRYRLFNCSIGRAAELYVPQGVELSDDVPTIIKEILGDLLTHEGAFEDKDPRWVVSRNSELQLVFTSIANASSVLMSFMSATVSDTNNAKRGQHTSPLTTPGIDI